MPNDKIRPFLAGERRDILCSLVATRNEAVHQSVIATVSKAMKPEISKIDGKSGGLDGSSTHGWFGLGDDISRGFNPPPREKKAKIAKRARKAKRRKTERRTRIHRMALRPVETKYRIHSRGLVKYNGFPLSL